jgi:hypothetical protein
MRFIVWGLLISSFFVFTLHADRSKILIQNQGVKKNEIYNPMFLFSKRFRNGDIYNSIFPLDELPSIKNTKGGFAEQHEEIQFKLNSNDYQVSLIYFHQEPHELYISNDYFEYNARKSPMHVMLKCKHKYRKKQGKIIVRVFKNKGRLLCWYKN